MIMQQTFTEFVEVYRRTINEERELENRIKKAKSFYEKANGKYCDPLSFRMLSLRATATITKG